MPRVFLAGTANDSTWRDQLKSILDIDFVDPIVNNWTDERKQIEIDERKNCDYILYVITPLMEGLYSIAELVDDSNKRPSSTLFCFLSKDTLDGKPISFYPDLLSSIDSIKILVSNNGAKGFNDLNEVAEYLNGR